ncbi:MAG: glycosyltransferase [Planctomycetia bacterium]
MAQRFSILGAELIRRGGAFELLTTGSLASEFNLPQSPLIRTIDDTELRTPLTSWLMLAAVFLRVSLGAYRRVHLAGAGRAATALFWACRVSGTPVSCTFASRTLEMASYGRGKDKTRWVQLLNRVDRIDVLNPGHNLVEWREKIFVSPCSFPSRMETLPQVFAQARDRLVVFCGAMEAVKNPFLALDIVDVYISTTGDRISILFFGDGPLKPGMKERIDAFNARHGDSRASFGKSDQLGEVLARANVFLSLQEADNYPSQALLEAMLMGCKFIATDEGDTHLMLPPTESRNSLVNSRSPYAFLHAMRVAFEDTVASHINADFARDTHSLARFAEYFTRFVHD